MALSCEHCAEGAGFIREGGNLYIARYFWIPTKFSSSCRLLGPCLDLLSLLLHVCTALVSSYANCRGLL